jgi:phosphoribosylanthranilate isomerase
MLVKICGITNAEDACLAQDAGADFVGMIFTESKRRIHPDTALEITGILHIPTVGVFLDQDSRLVNDICDYADLQYVQLHGNESPAYIATINRPVIKAFRVHENFDFGTISAYKNCYAILLDTYVPDEAGGTGTTFDWDLVHEARKHTTLPIFLSGGLTPDNVAEAIDITRPDGVDVASGVEAFPGKKDPQKVIDFIKNAAAATDTVDQA